MKQLKTPTSCEKIKKSFLLVLILDRGGGGSEF